MERLHSAFAKCSALISLTAPMVCTAGISEFAALVNLYFVGRLNGAQYIGAATLGSMMCNISGYSIMYGMCTALDSLLSQAYGAKSYRLVGLYAQRAMVIFTVGSLPVVLIWSQTDTILENLLSIDHETSRLACIWSKILALGLWPSLICEAFKRWLQSQNIVWPATLSAIISTLVIVAVNIYTQQVMQPPLGFEGVALGVVAMQWAALISLVLLIIMRKWWISRIRRLGIFSGYPQHDGYDVVSISDVENTTDLLKGKELGGKIDSECDAEDNFPDITLDIFREWVQFLRLGVPGAASLFIEWGSFELAAGIAGQLGTIPLAVHGIYASTAALFYMIPSAVANSTAILAGNYVGARNPKDAEAVVHLGLFISFIYGTVAGSILYFGCRPYWGAIFSDDIEVQNHVHSTLGIMFVYTIVDSSKCIALNVLRSTGRPSITVVVNTFVCICVMLPVGWYWGVYCQYGLVGLWAGMSLAWLCATIVFCIIVMKTDWSDPSLILDGAPAT